MQIEDILEVQELVVLLEKLEFVQSLQMQLNTQKQFQPMQVEI